MAEVRHSTPGVGLISPPPHHDIYSIEDLAQLIHDLKNANPQARIHVKLVSEVGVGTVAAGVSKAHADVVLISGHDGGTGATPLTSVKHAGAPWELGLAETQQTLLLNGLRDRIVVQVDGQLKTGRDVIVAALLGGEEFGFATAPLVVSGCIMMRVCHLDTCPVGVATQNPLLRKRFSRQAGVRRELLHVHRRRGSRASRRARLPHARTKPSARSTCWTPRARSGSLEGKRRKLDLSPILDRGRVRVHGPGPLLHRHAGSRSRQGARSAADRLGAATHSTRVRRSRSSPQITNVNRTVGTMLGHEVTKAYGGEGLPDGTIDITFTGSAGNSFGAFVPSGMTLRLHGDANDFVGKGLSGGRIVVRPPLDAAPKASSPRTTSSAATSSCSAPPAVRLCIRGVVGERFAVRNSGATAVVEGVGDHGCEYMTGGKVVILGATGRNFGAGMSGGVAYIYNPDKAFEDNLNTELVDLEDLEGDDFTWLKGVIERHRDETGSEVADAHPRATGRSR